MVSETVPIITLTTDFGLSDYFVGAVKGVLLCQIPEAKLVDITHLIPRHDIISAAFVVNEMYGCFPQGTIHLTVVDPGVGSARRKIIVTYKGQFFVAPDNGILSYILKEAECRVFEVVETLFLKLKESPTFAGRDHFSRIAAALAKGISPTMLGKEIFDAHQMDLFFQKKGGTALRGKIVYFDCFGNAITNLTQDVLKAHLKNPERFTANLSKLKFVGLKKNYMDAEKETGSLIMNSSGYLEIFVLNDSARNILKLNLSDEVIIG